MMGMFEHGGDLYGLEGVVDFSASLNPLGTPVQIVRALKVAAADFERYPDPLCRDLTADLASIEDVPAEHIVITAGATDAFMRIVASLRPHKALICTPCYSGYEQSLRQLHVRIVHHSLVARENFDMTERIIDYIEPDVDMMFLCSPNNPTGRVIPRDLLCKILRAADRWGTWVVLDESYLDFTIEHSATSLLDRYPRLIVVKTFTKIYAMAGLRVGWVVCGTSAVADGLREAGMPWIVSTPAQVAARVALDVPGYLDLTREYVAAERDILQRGLREAGMLVVPSHANFILFQSPMPLREPLLERGFAIRPCENFRGLDASWFRIAVRTTNENERLLAALHTVLRA
ncbi:MAG TPA: threonine-phosphate decarboxylase [Eggerthellaceae bacterium]|nr:threonine-phosphate decarboxylase [Eggerthellaceae bacterium]